MKDVTKDEFKTMLDFFSTAQNAVKDKPSADFICPKCGGTAHASKSSYNGHVWAKCDKCGLSAME